MEDEDDIVRHALLSDQDFLIAIDDKITTLIISALASIFDNLLLGHGGEMTKLGAHHDRNLPDWNLVHIEDLFLGLDFWLSLRRVAHLDLEDLDGAEDLSLVGDVPDPCPVRQDRLIDVVTFNQARVLVDSGASEDNPVGGLFVIGSIILSLLLNRCLAELLDDLLDGVLQEALEGVDLLRNKTILLEVTIDDLPAVVLVDGVEVYVVSPAAMRDRRLFALHFHLQAKIYYKRDNSLNHFTIEALGVLVIFYVIFGDF